jgi:hypothetical protein
MMTGRRSRVLALASLTLVACSSSNNSGTSSDDGGNGADVFAGTTDDGGGSNPDGSQTVMQTVGASGGTVTAGGVVLTIPPGALSSDTQISVTTSSASVPAGYVAVSPMFSFSPAGATFAVPVTVQITLTGSATGASLFMSNSSGGYDAFPAKSSTATTLSADVTHLGDCFAGEDTHDASVQADTGSSADTGAAAESGSTTDSGAAETGTGSSSDAGTSVDTGAATDATAVDDAGPTTDSGTTTPADAGTTPDSGGATDAGSAVEGGTSDAGTVADAGAVTDASTPGIYVTISGVATSFIYNVNAIPNQAWWTLVGDDVPSGAHWTMSMVVPNTPVAQIACGTFPSITYTHYTATGDAGTADMTFSTNVTGGSCAMTSTTTSQVQGSHAMGTFTGSLLMVTDSGNAPSKSLTAGSYDIIVP